MTPIDSGNALMARTRRGPNAHRLLLGCALAWAVMLIIVSVGVPILTIPTSQGTFQPRETVLAAYGVAGLLPAVCLLLVGATVAVLLRQRRATTATRALAIMAFVASYGSLLVLHIWSLLVVPYGALLLAAAFATEPREHRA